MKTFIVPRRVLWIVTVALSGCACIAFGQDYPLTFHEVQGVVGKPLGKIRNITQDPRGYMWFSGEDEKCLYRYDGQKLIIYRPDFTDPNTLGSTDINVVYADKQGMIWVGFNNGMDRFDPATETFTHFRHEETNTTSLSSGAVLAILSDRNGNLWVGTARGLDRLGKETGEFTHYRHDPNNPRSLTHNFVSSLYEDRQGTLWVATAGFPWEVNDPNAGGLNRMEPDGGFVRYRHDPTDPQSLASNAISAIFEDSRGVFWVGTGGDGLHTMDRATGKFHRHSFDPAHPDKLSRPPRQAHPWFHAVDVVTFIIEDHTGAIWFGALWGGITRYDPITQKLTRYNNSNGYPDDTSWNAFVSREGVLWITSNKPALFRVDPSRKMFEDVRIAPDQRMNTTRFLENGDGTLWVGSGAGLFHVDRAEKVLKNFIVRRGDEALIVIALAPDGPDYLWIGTHAGAYKLNTKTGQYKKLDLGVASALTIQILKDDDGSLWITDVEHGLIKYNDKSGAIKQFQTVPNDPTSLGSNHVTCLSADDSHLWVGTEGGGINRMDKRTEKFKRYQFGAKCTYLYRDKAGTLWTGTSNGLFKYDAKTDEFVPAGYNASIASERTYGIVEDLHKNLWVSGPSAIVRIDSARQVVSQFALQNGILPGSVTVGAIGVTRAGDLLIGNGGGYYKIKADALSFIEEPPHALFTSFLANNEPLSRELGGVDGPIENLATATLKHDENNLSISFAMPDYRDPEGNRFYSMLEGFDNEWRDVSADNSSLYLAVPPGDYTFRLRAYTSGGAMAEKAIAITLNPPWWKTWWAYSAYALIALALLFAARSVVVHQERLRANLRLEHVELEKAKEVDKVKTSFFANISHEFRTPLTLIDGPVQDLLERYANDPHTREKLKLIQRNADLLLKLINQLMDLARLEAGGLRLEQSEGDLNAFIRVVASSFMSLAKQKGVSLSIEIPVVVRPALYDKGKLETILINLINNAIKFTPSGGAVHVQSRADADGLFLSVRDSGIGIPVQEQQRVFERFHQVSESHKEVGTGIGLALVKELVAFLNGRIDLTSEMGKGTEFRVTLPVTLLQQLEPQIEVKNIIRVTSPNGLGTQSNNQQESQPVDEPVPDRYTILVVEDNADLRAFIIDSLGVEYHFLEAENGVEGVERATIEVPNLIVSDVMMPEMDGITMAKKIKKDIRTSHIPLIMLTAKSSQESKLQGLESGADDYLVKPFNKNELILKVRNAINRQDRMREKLRAELLSQAPTVAVLSDDEKFLDRVKKIILERMTDDQLGVESLSSEIGLSRSQLFRKITALTGLSVVELIRKLRLHRASQLIAQNWGPVAQVAYEVGFSNPSYFSKCFKDEFGTLPSEYYARTSVDKP